MCSSSFSVPKTAKLPELTPHEDTPAVSAVPPLTQTPSQPQQVELQAGATETTEFSRTERQPTSPHTTTSPNPPTTFDDYDVKDFEIPRLESIPSRGDTIPLPPLPSFEPQPPKLDISHDGGEGGAVDSSSSGGPPAGTDESRAVSLQTTTVEPSWSPKHAAEVGTPRQEVTTTPPPLPEVFTAELDPPSFSVEPGHHPAVVFKEHLPPGAASEPEQSGVVPAVADTFDPASVHIIIVSMPSSNHSGMADVWKVPMPFSCRRKEALGERLVWSKKQEAAAGNSSAYRCSTFNLVEHQIKGGASQML